MRIRQDNFANYKAVFLDSGKTIRFKLRSSEQFGVPATPEIEDVAINNKCYANCSYCYTSATSKGVNFVDVVQKADKVWGSLPIESRPFQIAIGGAGESTLHPEWVDFVRHVRSLQIVPNYTTNGMHLSDKILEATQEFCRKYCDPAKVNYSILPSKRSLLQIATLSYLAFLRLSWDQRLQVADDIVAAAKTIATIKGLTVEEIRNDFEEYLVNTSSKPT